jgi:hypothetical protein
VEELQQAVDTYRRLSRLGWLRWPGAFLLTGLALLGGSRFGGIWWILPITWAGNIFADNSVEKELRGVLHRVHRNPQAAHIPLLIRLLKIRSPRCREIARRSLRRILPKVTSGDGLVLEKRSLHTLNYLLFSPDRRLVRAVLPALRVVGDAGTVQALQVYLSAMQEYGADRDPSLAEEMRTAEEILEALQMQLEEARRVGLLLRPASAVHGDGERLVRPLKGEEAGAECLLRPAAHEGD